MLKTLDLESRGKFFRVLHDLTKQAQQPLPCLISRYHIVYKEPREEDSASGEIKDTDEGIPLNNLFSIPYITRKQGLPWHVLFS